MLYDVLPDTKVVVATRVYVGSMGMINLAYLQD